MAVHLVHRRRLRKFWASPGVRWNPVVEGGSKLSMSSSSTASNPLAAHMLMRASQHRLQGVELAEVEPALLREAEVDVAERRDREAPPRAGGLPSGPVVLPGEVEVADRLRVGQGRGRPPGVQRAQLGGRWSGTRRCRRCRRHCAPVRSSGVTRPICQSQRIGRPVRSRCGGYQQAPPAARDAGGRRRQRHHPPAERRARSCRRRSRAHRHAVAAEPRACRCRRGARRAAAASRARRCGSVTAGRRRRPRGSGAARPANHSESDPVRRSRRAVHERAPGRPPGGVGAAPAHARARSREACASEKANVAGSVSTPPSRSRSAAAAGRCRRGRPRSGGRRTGVAVVSAAVRHVPARHACQV